MDFTDTITIDAPRRTPSGYLAASVRVARTGVQIYSGREVDPDNVHGMRDKAQVRVYRDEAEVFSKSSLATLAHKPITIDHPPVAVTADNWRDYAVGAIGDEIARDGDFVRVPIAIMDGKAIAAIDGGKNQLSCGYSCDLLFGDGTSPSGEQYDAKQTGIKYNHLSAVDLARGGDKLKIGDAKPMKTILVDGHSVEVSDAAEIAIAGLNAKLTAAQATITGHATADAKTALDIAAKDAKIATLDAEVATLKASQLTGDAMDKAVAARAQLVTDAKTIGGENLDVTGSNAEIKRRAVLAKLGDKYSTKDEAFFDAAFELQLAGLVGADTMRDGITTLTPSPQGEKLVSDARAGMIGDLNKSRTAAAN